MIASAQVVRVLVNRAVIVGPGESALWLTRIRLFGGILAVDFLAR
jgi:hypothetical protein